MIREVISDVLLALAVLTVAAAALGVAVMPDAYARLHYVTPAAVVHRARAVDITGTHEGS